MFSAVCGGLAWFSWMASQSSQVVETAAGGDLESWRRSVRSINVLWWVLILGIVALNMALLVTWGFAVAMVWTVGCLVAASLLTQGMRTVRMWRLGLSRERVREIERELRGAAAIRRSSDAPSASWGRSRVTLCERPRRGVSSRRAAPPDRGPGARSFRGFPGARATWRGGAIGRCAAVQASDTESSP